MKVSPQSETASGFAVMPASGRVEREEKERHGSQQNAEKHEVLAVEDLAPPRYGMSKMVSQSSPQIQNQRFPGRNLVQAPSAAAPWKRSTEAETTRWRKCAKQHSTDHDVSSRLVPEGARRAGVLSSHVEKNKTDGRASYMRILSETVFERAMN